MTDDEIKRIWKGLQEGEEFSTDVMEVLVLELLTEKGLVTEDSATRKAYRKFFNKVRLSESQYNGSRDNLNRMEKATDIIKKALERLEEDLA